MLRMTFVFLCLLTLPSAFAYDKDVMIVVEGSQKWLKGVSGVSGSIVQTNRIYTCQDYLGRDRQCNKIHSLDLRESTDDVIRINVIVDHINPDSLLGVDGKYGAYSKSYDLPNRTAPTLSSLIATVGEHKVITAVQACMNNEKLKGIRLWGVHVNKDATLGKNAKKAEAKRKNCKPTGWAKKLSCAKNKIVTNMRFHYKNKKDGYSGISIQCSKISLNEKPTSTSPKFKVPTK